MDVVTAVLQAQVNQILIFAGIIIVFFTLFNIGFKPFNIQIRSIDKTNNLIVIIAVIFGAVFILGGIFYPKSKDASSAESTPASVYTPGITIGSPTPTLQPIVAAVTQTPEVPNPTVISTATTEPTSAPQIKTFADRCIAAQTWKPDSIDATAIDAVSTSETCLNLSGLNITIDQPGTLHFFASKDREKLASGIFTPISDQSTIEFSVTVTQLSIFDQGDNAFLIFAITPQNKPSTSESQSGYIKFLVNSKKGSINYWTAGAGDNPSKLISSQPKLKTTVRIKLVLTKLSMKIYIDNSATEAATVSLPNESKVLYIGYSLYPLNTIDATISGLKIDGQTP